MQQRNYVKTFLIRLSSGDPLWLKPRASRVQTDGEPSVRVYRAGWLYWAVEVGVRRDRQAEQEIADRFAKKQAANLSQYSIDEEWWRWHNLRETLARLLVCPVVGHDPMTKFDGTKLCRRCHGGTP